MPRILLAVLWALMLTACAPAHPFDATAPALVRGSTWGAVWTVGRAPSLDAPALLTDTDSLWVAWADSARGVVVQRRTLSADRLLTETILSGVSDARAVTLHHISDERLLVLWLARDPNGETRLFAATLAHDLTLTLAPAVISDAPTLRYTVTTNGFGVWVVWSGGRIAEPSLYAQAVDAVGRAQVPTLLMQNADYPALATDPNGAFRLFWLRAHDSTPHAATLTDGRLADVRALTSPAPLTLSDRLVSLHAAFDRTHGYLFWNVVDAEGRARVYISVGAESAWDAPRVLGLVSRAGDAPQVGFNVGTVESAAYGESAVAWLIPLTGAGEVLPAAAWFGDAWGALYFQGGDLIGMQRIFTAQADALGHPALAVDRARHLTLAWASPRADDSALLEITTTR